VVLKFLSCRAHASFYRRGLELDRERREGRGVKRKT